MKDKVLITGIAGSGGSYLAQYLVDHCPDVEVHGISRWHSTTTVDNIRDIRSRITVHESDLLDLSSTIRVIKKVKPTKIFNLASHANVRVCYDEPLAVLNNNIFSTANLLEAIRLESPECMFLQCSTSEVYGNPLTFPITEEHPMRPLNPYSVSKLTQETLAYSYYKCWNLRVIITRMFSYINPRRQDIFATAFANQIVQIENGEKQRLHHGNLQSIRSIIDVRDAMESYWVAAQRCQEGEIYNIGGSVVVSVREILERLIAQAGCKIEIYQDKGLLRPTDIIKQVPDVSKFTKQTGWVPKIPLDESLAWLLEECRKTAALMKAEHVVKE
jgi:GDP-4-dehydro-6-deoxy-D-mannose reductase